MGVYVNSMQYKLDNYRLWKREKWRHAWCQTSTTGKPYQHSEP